MDSTRIGRRYRSGSVIVYFADAHVTTSPPQVVGLLCSALRSWARNERIAAIRSVGDLMSFALESTPADCLAHPAFPQVSAALRDAANAVDLKVMDGNHDPWTLVPEMAKALVETPESVFPGLVYMDDVANDFLVICNHGHGKRYDPTTAMWQFVTGALREALGVAAATKFMRAVIRFWLKHRRLPTPREVKSGITGDQRIVSEYHVALTAWMHERYRREAISLAISQGLNGDALFVTGHSHSDELWHKPTLRARYLNPGALDGGGETFATVEFSRNSQTGDMQWVKIRHRPLAEYDGV